MHEVPLLGEAVGYHVMLLASRSPGGYIRNTAFPPRSPSNSAVYRFVYRKWMFDELYDVVFVRPAFWIGRQFWKIGDVGIIDRFGPDGAAWAGRRARPTLAIQSGYLNLRMLVMLLGAGRATGCDRITRWAIFRFSP
jgi:NADH-quinone oxidoreductase subunit L